MKCPKCNEEMDLRGIWRNEVELSVTELKDGLCYPNYFEDEVADYRELGGSPVETFYRCFECNIRVYEEKVGEKKV